MMFKLISDQERFWFMLDSNLDGSFTISDIPTLLHQLFFLPGDLVFYFLYHFIANNPGLIKLFRIKIKSTRKLFFIVAISVIFFIFLFVFSLDYLVVNGFIS